MFGTTVRRRVLAVAAALATGAALLAAPPATAGTARDGKCQTGEFCLYFNSNQKGSVSDFTGNIADYGSKQPSCYEFKSAGNGKGKCVKNNAASAWNRSTKTVYVYYNSNYNGSVAKQAIKPGAKVNLNAKLKNQNAGHSFGVVKTPSIKSGDDYPYRGQSSNGVDPWGFYKVNCTSFAAWAIKSRLNYAGFSNRMKGGHFGNAINWAKNAKRIGIPVYTTPKVGDIAVRESGTYGHVAFVTSVNKDGSFQVDEYNHIYRYKFSHRTATKGLSSHQFNKFIRFK